MKKLPLNARSIVCIVLALFYIASLILLIMRKTDSGILCLGISTVCGMGVLYYINKKDKAAREEKEQEDNRD